VQCSARCVLYVHIHTKNSNIVSAKTCNFLLTHDKHSLKGWAARKCLVLCTVHINCGDDLKEATYCSTNSHCFLILMVGSLKMNTALEYSTRVVQEGDRRCKKSTLNDLAYLTPLRIPLMNPVLDSTPNVTGLGLCCVFTVYTMRPMMLSEPEETGPIGYKKNMKI
jgi:hypothetical protein